MARRYPRLSHHSSIETGEFMCDRSPLSIPLASRASQAAVVTAVLMAVLGMSLWNRAELLSPTPAVAAATMSAFVLGVFGVAYMVLERLESTGDGRMARVRFGEEGIAIMRKGSLEKKRSYHDLALASADDKDVSLLFDDGELVTVPLSAFGSAQDLQHALRLAKPHGHDAALARPAA